MTLGEPQSWQWSEDDFNTLLANPQRPTDALAKLLPDHTATTIAIARWGICDFHKRRPNFFLTDMMVEVLRTKKGKRVCHVCDELY